MAKIKNKYYRALTSNEFVEIETNPNLHAVEMQSKCACNLIMDRETKKAILHTGANGSIYMTIEQLYAVLNEALDILVFHADC